MIKKIKPKINYFTFLKTLQDKKKNLNITNPI